MPIKYELRCKRIPRKYLYIEGYVYDIEWTRVAGKTFDVAYIDYTSFEHTEENIRAVYVSPFIIIVKPSQGCSECVRKKIATFAKYTELWAVYPNYKRRVW